MLANGGTTEELLAEYPSLSGETSWLASMMPLDLAEEQVTPIQVANV